MNDDALKKLWREPGFDLPPSLASAEQVASVRRKARGFGRAIFWRDFREVAACLLIIFWFGAQLFRPHPMEMQLGCWVLILSAIFIASKLLVSKRSVPAADASASIEEVFQLEIRRVDVQIRLLSSVGWWYLLPLLAGVNLFFAGSRASPSGAVFYSLFTFFL